MDTMTQLGKILKEHSSNRAEISRKTDISTSRLYQLSNNDSSVLKASEVYLIAMAIGINPGYLLDQVCNHLKLNK